MFLYRGWEPNSPATESGSPPAWTTSNWGERRGEKRRSACCLNHWITRLTCSLMFDFATNEYRTLSTLWIFHTYRMWATPQTPCYTHPHTHTHTHTHTPPLYHLSTSVSLQQYGWLVYHETVQTSGTEDMKEETCSGEGIQFDRHPKKLFLKWQWVVLSSKTVYLDIN